MAQNCKTTAGKAVASRDLLGGWSRRSDTLAAQRAQYLAIRFALPIETAALIAALAFGGAAHG